MSTAAHSGQISYSFTYELEDVKDPAAHNTLLLALATYLPQNRDLRELCSKIGSTNTERLRKQLLKTFDCTIVANSLHPVWVAQGTLPISEPPSLTKLALPNSFPAKGWELASGKQKRLRSMGHLECFQHLRALMQSVPQGGRCTEDQEIAIVQSAKRLADSKASERFCAVLDMAVDEYNSVQPAKRGKNRKARRSSKAFDALRDAASTAIEVMTKYVFTVETTWASHLCLSTMCYTLGDTRTTEQMLALLKDIREQCRSDSLLDAIDSVQNNTEAMHIFANTFIRGEGTLENKIARLRLEQRARLRQGDEEDEQSRSETGILSTLDAQRALVKSVVNEAIVLTSDHDVCRRHISKLGNSSGNIESWGVTLVDPPLRFPAQGWTLANNDQRLMRRLGDDPTISSLSNCLRLGHDSQWKDVEPSLLLEKTKKLLDHDHSTPGVKEFLTDKFQPFMHQIAVAYQACESKLQAQETTQTLTLLPEFITLHHKVEAFLRQYTHFVFTVAPEEVDSTTIEPASDGSPSA